MERGTECYGASPTPISKTTKPRLWRVAAHVAIYLQVRIWTKQLSTILSITFPEDLPTNVPNVCMNGLPLARVLLEVVNYNSYVYVDGWMALNCQWGTEVPLRRSALGVYPGGDPWGTPLQLETSHSWALVKVTSAKGHFGLDSSVTLASKDKTATNILWSLISISNSTATILYKLSCLSVSPQIYSQC